MMKVTVTTRHMDDADQAEGLRKYVLKKTKKIERYVKYQRTPSELKLVLATEKFRNTAEVFVNSGVIKAASSAQAADMHAAIDEAIDGVVKQLKKQTEKKIKTKRRNVWLKNDQKTVSASGPVTIKRDETESVKIEKVPPKPMSIEEAILQLRVSGADLLSFYNSETGEVNVLYKRRGNKVVLITP